jgi:nucleotide-binding universal stress UspA family protein
MYNQADRYLDKVQRRLEKKGINARTEVLLGKPADAIISYADQHCVDLIVMASHGRSGISRWASGSVADRIFRGSCIPVLLVRAPGCGPGL